MSEVFIYTLECPLSNEVRYVGKTINIKKRLNDHLKSSKKLKTHKDKWINSLLSQNLKPIIKELKVVNNNDWIYWEIYSIDFFKKLGCNLVNHTNGGDGGSFTHHNEETKKKISDAHKGRKRPEFSEEWRKKLSESGKKKVFTEKHKENISKSLKGRKLNPRSEEYRKKMSDSKKNTKVSEEVKKYKQNTSPSRRQIICVNNKTIYHSISFASRELKIPISTIIGVLKERRKSAKGLIFKYYE